MSELYVIRRNAIRYRHEELGVTDPKDLKWLLYDNNRLVEAIERIVSAADDGADAYEVRHELALAASAAGLPDRDERRRQFIQGVTAR